MAFAKFLHSQSAASGSGNGLSFDISSLEQIAVQFTTASGASSGAGTLYFEGSIDGATWAAVPMKNYLGNVVNSATTPGVFVSDHLIGYKLFRTRLDSATILVDAYIAGNG